MYLANTAALPPQRRFRRQQVVLWESLPIQSLKLSAISASIGRLNTQNAALLTELHKFHLQVEGSQRVDRLLKVLSHLCRALTDALREAGNLS